MQSIVLYMIYGFSALILLYWIPLTREIVRPLLTGIGNIVVWVFTESISWVIYVIKIIIKSHTDLIFHLQHRKSEIVAEEKIKELERNSIKD